MDARVMYDLEETICKDLEPYAKKGSMTRNDLETVFYLTGSIKNLMKINMMQEGGSSYGDGEWNAMGSYSSGRMPMSQNMRGGYQNGSSGRRRDGYNGTSDPEMYDRMRMRMEDRM